MCGGGCEESSGVLGHRKVITRSDSEPAILAFKEAVRRETDLEIVLAGPVGHHQANGLVENAVKNVQGQLRGIKDTLETSAREELTENAQ